MRVFHAVIMQSGPFGYQYRSLSVADFIGHDSLESLDCADLYLLTNRKCGGADTCPGYVNGSTAFFS
jgi:hypothetical protein